MLLTPWCTSAPETTTLIGRGNYQQLKADKPFEHMRHRATQGLIFTQSETAEIRLTFCIEITNPGMHIHTSDWIHGYSELSAQTWWRVTGPLCGEFTGYSHRALMFSLICAWINSWVNNRETGDLRCHCIHYDVTVMNEWRVEQELSCGRSQDYENYFWSYIRRSAYDNFWSILITKIRNKILWKILTIANCQ